MQNFQNPFEARKRSFISAFSICMTVPLTYRITLVILYYHVQWFVYKSKALNTQGKTARHFYVNEAFRGFRILFHIATITICSFSNCTFNSAILEVWKSLQKM